MTKRPASLRLIEISVPDTEVMTAMAYEWRSEVSLWDHRPREPPVTVISTPRHRLAYKKFLVSLIS